MVVGFGFFGSLTKLDNKTGQQLVQRSVRSVSDRKSVERHGPGTVEYDEVYPPGGIKF